MNVKRSLEAIASILLFGAWGATSSLAASFPRQETLPDREIKQLTSQQPTTDRQLLQQGTQLFDAQRFAEAARVWERAAATLEAEGNRWNQALALSYLSLAYQKLGRWEPAEKAIAQSLSLLPIKETSQADNPSKIIAAILNAKGYLQLARGQSEQALETWRQAANHYERIKDMRGVIGTQINQAQALQSLGMYRQARKTLESLATPLQNQPDSAVKLMGLRSLGNALRAIGDLDKSQELLQQSLTVAKDLKATESIAATYFSLGNTAVALAKRAENAGDREQQKIQKQAAFDAYQQAAILSTSPTQQVEIQLNLLTLLVETEQLEEFEALFSQIETQLAQLPPSRRSIYARSNLAQILLNVKNESNSTGQRKIAQLLAIAVRQAQTLGDDRAESHALGKLGELYELNQQWTDAERVTQQALLKAQVIQAADITYRWQWQLGRILKGQGKIPEATAAYTVAYETLQSLRTDLVAINPDNPDIQFSFRQSVEPVYRELVALLLTAEKGQQPSQTKLKQARQVIESLQLAELDNFFRESCLDARQVSIDQIDPQAASVYGIILLDRIHAIATWPGGILRHYSTSVPQAEIQKTLRRLRGDLGRPRSFKLRILNLSQQVYDWVIRPMEADLERYDVKTLVFVLDGLLRNVPMAVLHDGERYLIEKYGVAIAPGLQLLDVQPLTRQQIAALTAGLSEGRHGFSPLPNVERELKQILENIQTTRLLLNQNFTSATLQNQLNQSPFPIVHIATHGQFSSQAENTFILAYDRPINVKELDRFLRNRGEGEPIELLVFSACQTAAGDDRAALGLAGVAVRAGARSTLATLWNVSDESTATLMIEFYQQLAKPGTSKAQALRRAQIKLLNQQDFELPYFWAPYVLVGNWL